MHPHLKSLAAVAVLSVACGAVKADQTITCPPAVMSDQIQVRGHAGWVGAYLPDIKLKLESAGAMLGPLNTMGVLKGEVSQKGDSTVHRFSLTGGVADQLDKWMACTYGGNVYQAIKLPASTKECTVTYRRQADQKADPPYVLDSVTCR